MKTDDIREKYLQFFKQKGHEIKKSDSLIPSRDPSLLFSSAGMVQFKPMWLAEGDLPFTRATTSQKCFRTTDIENVGMTARHHTFFEMLGNFSFGDYFKEDAITWAWEFVTEVCKLPKSQLWVSYYQEDKEAFEIWNKKAGVPAERLKPFGKDNNYWPAEPGINTWVGACGPCTEIFIDYGPERSCGKPTCSLGCDCDRYEEIWNVVFPQFYRSEKGELSPLPKRGVDTGMGLERLASILQGGSNNFEIDILRPIMDAVASRAETEYGKNDKTDVSLKLITDHVRAVCFLVADGVMPSNEGRGYVLRRIIRRAVRHGKLLNIEKPFLYKLVSVVAEQMKKPYPEIQSRREYISQVLLNEEERFFHTLTQGMQLLQDVLDRAKEKAKQIPGAEAFKLYDTFGFPVELTKEIASEQGVTIDEPGFEACLDEQRHRAKSAWTGFGQEAVAPIYSSLSKKLGVTPFVGYETVNSAATILALVIDGKERPLAEADASLEVVLDQTPFYPEGGGQTGDVGVLVTDKVKIEVTDTLKLASGIIVHKARIVRGEVKVGDKVQAEVNQTRRCAAARNHTSTHLLQSALRHVLGKHVEQSGSLVEPDRLRFDFAHFGSMTESEIKRVEEIVNEHIRNNYEVKTKETDAEEAKKLGALAFFGEKYGDKVRVVTIGEVSAELCGGTHVSHCGEIGLCKIVSESGVAAGVRRLEALSGEAAYLYLSNQEETLKEAALLLKSPAQDLLGALKKFMAGYKEQERLVQQLQSRLSSTQLSDLMANMTEVKGLKVLAAKVEGMGSEALRQMADNIRVKLGSGVVVLGSVVEDKIVWIAAVTADLTKKVSASDVVKKVAAVTGGGGGGRTDFAQAGGKEVNKLDEAIRKVPEILEELVQ